MLCCGRARPSADVHPSRKILMPWRWCYEKRLQYCKTLSTERWGHNLSTQSRKVKWNLNRTTLVLIWSTYSLFFNTVSPADKTWELNIQTRMTWQLKQQKPDYEQQSKSCFYGEGINSVFDTEDNHMILTTYQPFCQIFYHWKFQIFIFFPKKLWSSSSRN